jgi:hypothetical protein
MHTSNVLQVGTRGITSIMMLNVSYKRQNNLHEQPIENPFPQQSLNLPIQEKKNVPPLGLEPTNKQSKINIFTPINTKGKWTN